MGQPRYIGSLRTERRLGVKGHGYSKETQSLFRELYRNGWLTSSRKAHLHAVLLLRDGTECWLCEKPLSPETLSIDHLVPVSHLKALKIYRNKGDDYDNLRLAHRKCNSKRGNLMPGGKQWKAMFPNLLKT